ncbi:extensin [Iris pallida]|uniref:Extensin n=1 Tax=Iris pallida TaxID=29817 RepID=A0AAX6ICB0_IRIPA|nr:extensin [Iris pallida]
MSTVYGIQGQPLDVTIVGCSKLKDTEWLSRQDPYVCLEYASTKYRTRTCTDGGKHPVFQEKTVIPLIEGLREITVTVWNSNTINLDDFIGSGRIQLQKVLSQGYDDSSWPVQSKSGKYAGDVKVILHFHNAQKPQQCSSSYSPSAPMQAYAPPPQYAPAYPPAAPYSAAAYPPAQPAAPYLQSAYPPPMMQYPQQQTYPYPSPYNYPSQSYPLPPAQPYYPSGPYSGAYPPPPY